MKTRLLCLLFVLAMVANAHFVFVLPQPGERTAQVILSETLLPNDEVDIALISNADLRVRDSSGRETPLRLTMAGHAYTTSLPGRGTKAIYGVVDLGLQDRGTGKNHLLVYYPKTIVGDPFDPATVVAGTTPVEIVPVGKAAALRLKLLVRGKPQPNAEITVLPPGRDPMKLKTDDSGLTTMLTETGRYGVWARYWEAAGGERDGKRYVETRNYATLVFDVNPGGTMNPTAGPPLTATRFATLPQATSSFGAVASDGWLYVYGGHIAPTHSYSTAAVSGQFARLKLGGETKWESLPSGPALQGMNLAVYKGKIYRIGGMAPRNKPGDAVINESVADCARFDPVTMQWEALPPLLKARSSHDVVVVGDELIVVGGWTLKGTADAEWPDTLEILDLSSDTLHWRSVPQPFKRRALIATAHSGKMYVMGGFDENSTVIHEVAIYDPTAGRWAKGSVLPGDELDGFAPAACTHRDRLYVSVGDGTLYRLNESGPTWEKVGNATPRIAHRMVSDGATILILGGATKGKNSDLIEATGSNLPR